MTELYMPGQRLAELIREALDAIPDADFVLTDYGLDFWPAGRRLTGAGGSIPFDTDDMAVQWGDDD